MEDIRYFFAQTFWVDAGKIVLALFMFVMSGLAIWVSFRFQRWYDRLALLEVAADRLRDDVMFEFTALRSRLSQVSARLNEPPAKFKFAVTEETVRHAGAIVLLLLKKERSILEWGFIGARIASDIVKRFVARR